MPAPSPGSGEDLLLSIAIGAGSFITEFKEQSTREPVKK
jgi:hypothetical protein